MEDQIVTYLEQYGQPQSVDAIIEHGLGGSEEPHAVVEATLEGMVASGRIKLVQAGTHANGEPTLEYAPTIFSA